LNRDGKKIKDSQIKSYLRRLISGEESVYGYRKLTRCLVLKYGLIINKKKVYRLCKALGILLPQREQRNTPPRKLANNREVTGPNQLWQMDIKYGYISGKRRYFFLASIIDVYDRSIVGHYRGKECRKEHIRELVNRALLRRQVYQNESQRLVIRTDNGPQFVSKDFYEFCQGKHIEHERIPNHTPNKNAYIESFHSVLERECYSRNIFTTFEEAYEAVDKYIRFYNERRIHGSLKGWPPNVFFQKTLNGTVETLKIAL
jgi:putative transposase